MYLISVLWNFEHDICLLKYFQEPFNGSEFPSLFRVVPPIIDEIKPEENPGSSMSFASSSTKSVNLSVSQWSRKMSCHSSQCGTVQQIYT